MQSYRVYVLDTADRIVRGEWMEAADDELAKAAAHARCDTDHPSVELWQANRFIARLPCDDKPPMGQPIARISRS